MKRNLLKTLLGSTLLLGTYYVIGTVAALTYLKDDKDLSITVITLGVIQLMMAGHLVGSWILRDKR